MDDDVEYFEGEPCDQCESTNYCIVNGTRICRNGHDQGDGQIIGEDEDDFGTQGRTVRKKKAAKSKVRVSRVYRGSKAYRLFIQAYQFVLWNQCYALVHEKNLPPETWTIVRDLWALRLSQLLHRINTEQATTDAESQALSSGENSGVDGARSSPKIASKGIDSPKLVETIALCYMGMLLLRLPDILYIRAIRAVPLDMREKLPGEYHMVLDTTAMLHPEDLHGAVSDLARLYYQTFGLVLPSLNHEVLLYKYIMFLAVPLEVFSTVQRLSSAIRSEFHWSVSKDVRRKQSSAFPELHLMSLLVIVVKLLYPFDDVRRQPRSIQEPTIQQTDWMSWKQHWKEFSKNPPGAGLVPDSHIDVHDTDVFDMSQQEMDSYMDWYQKTWVREPRPGSDDSVNQEILDMFPLWRLDPAIGKTPSQQRESDLIKALTKKAQAATASTKFETPVSDDKISDDQIKVNRPAERYQTYNTKQDLSEVAKAFYAAAAEAACTSVRNLLLAVGQTEVRITKWKRAKRRAEITGEEFNLDAEMGLGSDTFDEDRSERVSQQNMEAMNIQRNNATPEENEQESSDVDMLMISN